MKRKSLLLLFLFAVSALVSAQNLPKYSVRLFDSKSTNLILSKSRIIKKMPITVDEPITNPPAGTTHENLVRQGYSFYYENGYVNGAHNDGFIGEYVKGDDGCIYIKNPFASLNLGTYLKLDKVDDETYVAHTAQLVWVDNSESTPFTGFATRLVFKNVAGGKFTYEVADDQNTDMYFTLKDGVLSQTNQETQKVGEYEYPAELLGVTNSDGGWLGIGDGNMLFYEAEAPVVVPEGADVKEVSILYNILSSTSGKNNMDAQLTKMAEVGDDIYLASPYNDGKHELWMKGHIDRQTSTVTFRPQYLGVNTQNSCHQWLRPSSFYDWFDLIDEEDGYGVWYRAYNDIDSYVFKYENGSLVSDTTSMKQSLVVARSPKKSEASAVISNAIVKNYVAKSAKPAKPSIVHVEPHNGMFGYITFSLPPVDVDGMYMDPNNMSYSFYVYSDDRFTFKKSTFEKLPEDTNEIPYFYADPYDFMVKTNGYHTVIYYDEAWSYIGIQSIQRYNGDVNCSEIEWYNHTPTGIEKVPVEEKANINGKMFKDGKLVIVKAGKVYDVAGRRIN
jgi:hypothetical protein